MDILSSGRLDRGEALASARYLARSKNPSVQDLRWAASILKDSADPDDRTIGRELNAGLMALPGAELLSPTSINAARAVEAEADHGFQVQTWHVAFVAAFVGLAVGLAL